MPFSVGDEVVVTALQKRGCIVETAASGRYRVVVGALTTWCDESQLSSVSQGKKKAKRERMRGAATGSHGDSSAGVLRETSERERRRLQSIDLHGMTVEEALRAVEARLDEAIRAGVDRLEIIHGISGGRLRAAVRGYLAGIESVKRVEPDAKNPGVTLVFF